MGTQFSGGPADDGGDTEPGVAQSTVAPDSESTQ